MANAVYMFSLGLAVFAISAGVAIISYAIGGLVTSVALTLPTVLLTSFAVSWLDALVARIDDEEVGR